MNRSQLGYGQFEEVQLIDRQCNNEAPRLNLNVRISFESRVFQPIGCRTNRDPIMLFLWCEVGLLFEDSQVMTEEVTGCGGNLESLRI